MPNLADIPVEFREPTKVHQVITWIRTLPLDPDEKRDLLFLWATDQSQHITKNEVELVQSPIVGRKHNGQ